MTQSKGCSASARVRNSTVIINYLDNSVVTN